MNIALIVIGIVGVIAFIVAGIVVKIHEENKKFYNDREDEKVKYPRWAIIGIIASVMVFLIGNSFVIIPTGNTGVKSTFGQIDERPVGNGINWKLPFVQKIKKVNNKQQDITFEDQVWGETSERTSLYYSGITITYRINPEMSSWIYANVTDYEKDLVSYKLVTSAIKTSSKTLSSVDATNRGMIEPLAMENIQKALDEKYGENVVTVNKVVIAGADFEESYNEAISEKQKAQLEYERQQIENKKNIEAAEADAKVKLTNAQATADAAVIKAKGEADANKLLNDSLTDKVLQKDYLDKWDGALPKATLSDNAGAMIDLKDVTE